MAAHSNTQRARKQDHRTRVGRERSARTETRILEAALRVFGEMGPDAPKIDDFVLAAGISRGTFYNHFESVEELLAATSEWLTRELIETIETRLDGDRRPCASLWRRAPALVCESAVRPGFLPVRLARVEGRRSRAA